MTELKDLIPNFIAENFFQFAINEYHWNDNIGGQTHKMHKNMSTFIQNPEVEKIVSDLKIFTKMEDGVEKNLYDEIVEFIISGQYFSRRYWLN